MKPIENDPEMGARDDYRGPKEFVSLFFLAIFFAVFGWGIVKLWNY